MGPQNNPYQSQKAVIQKIIPETSGIKTFVVQPESGFSFHCGQFAELSVPGIGEAPFAMSSPCFKSEQLEFTIQNVGYMTSRLHAMKEGDIVGIRGPYGNGFPLDDFYGKEVLLLIGGVGFPPARTLIYSLLNEKNKFKRIILCYGARTPEDVVYKYQVEDFRKKIELYMTVDKADKNWRESEGVVTVLLDKVKVDLKNSAAVVIGPPIMMKFGTFKLLEVGYQPKDIYLSMERKMYCGIGQCRHCMIDHYFICKDGPVFTYEQLKNFPNIWE
ncbi:FAD/NAD(P)-binding protein [bacterium]|nr:FAD/NAD(P)-binding protein [bacterium]